MYNINPHLKIIEVDFDSTVNTSTFNQNAFSQISNNGLHLNEISLIHYASLHYQSKFSNSPARRLRYTLDTIEPSIINPSVDAFCFSGDEESELQKTTSEVIGVGFALSLMHKLIDIRLSNFNRIPITGPGKRCDFEVISNGERFIIESKGRKTNITGAKREILAQKNNYNQCVKYGVVSHIPRNGTPAKLYVTDPEVDFSEASKEYNIISILNHYSKVARLSGFYRMSEKLNQRIDRLAENEGAFEELNKTPLEYGSVVKLGKSIQFIVSDMEFASFFSPNIEVGLKILLKDNSIMMFGMEQTIFELLEKQDFDALLEYQFKNFFGEMHSILDNGTFLVKTDYGKIKQLFNSSITS